jgi:hypothetical protein
MGTKDIRPKDVTPVPELLPPGIGRSSGRVTPNKITRGIGRVLFLLLTANLATAAEYPFIGKWDCDGGIFTFTNRTYNNGGKTIVFSRIDFGKRDFKLTFLDGYAISLLNVTGKTMTWQSWATGDMFDCKRIR